MAASTASTTSPPSMVLTDSAIPPAYPGDTLSGKATTLADSTSMTINTPDVEKLGGELDIGNALVIEDVGLDSPPEGGYGWVVVAASFLVHVVVIGIEFSFGVYLDYYNNEHLGSKSTLAFIGTVGVSMILVVGAASGRLAELFGFRLMMFIGTILLSMGLILASFATQVWHYFLTQGVLFGIGASLCYFPVVSIPSQYFSRLRGFATGIAVAGSGIGGFILVLMTQKLADSIGLVWTLRVTGISAFVLLSAATSLIKTRIPPAPQSKTDFSVWRDIRFDLLFITEVLSTLGFLVPIYYVELYAGSIGIASSAGALMASIYNLSSAVGRVLIDLGADMFGRLNGFTMCLFLSGVSMLAMWITATNFGELMAFSIVNGLFSGGVISLFHVVIADLFGAERLPSIMGMLYTSTAIGFLAGSPLAGVIVDASGYTAAIIFAGVLTIMSSIIAMIVRFIQEKSLFKVV